VNEIKNSRQPGDGMTEQEYRQFVKEWREKVQALYSKRQVIKRAGGLPDNVNKITKIELISYKEMFAKQPAQKFAFTQEELAFLKGKKELRVYFDTGRVSAIGPFAKMPSRIEIKSITVLEKPMKVLIIEE
jgi:hypothetical protein